MTRQRTAASNILELTACLVTLLVVSISLAPAAAAQNPVPFIDQPLVPDATAPGAAGFTLTVSGAGFVPASVVNWNGSPRATTFVNNHQLTAAILASDIAAASTSTVTVVNPSPGGGISNIQYFSIAAAATSVSFQPMQLYNANEQFAYYSIAIEDLNGDGIPDVVIASQNISSLVQGLPTVDGSVEIFLGNGDGTFQSPVSYDSGGILPGTLAIADVNGDGKLDVVVGNRGNGSAGTGVGLLLGNGDGTLQKVGVVSTLYSPSLVVADVNGDGKLDLIIASVNQDFIGGGLADVLLGNGDGTFQPATVYTSGASGAGSIAVADVNGDGKLDLIMTGPCPTTGFSCAGSPYPDAIVSVLLGNGNGTFQSPLMYDSGGYAFGGYPSGGVTVADVNADGKPDLLVGNCQLSGYGCQNATVAVLLGNGNGSFQPAAIYYAGSVNSLTASVSSIAAADVNMDGKVDVVATTWYGSAVTVLLGNGDGTFQPFVSSDSGAVLPSSVAVADLNGDGKPDAAVANCGIVGLTSSVCEGSMGVLLNDVGSVQTSTTTILASSQNPSTFGQPVTLTATVKAASGTPTGTVTFSDASTATTIGSTTLAKETAFISVSSLAPGTHSITAAYQGSGNFDPSTSASLSQIVNDATTTTSLTSSVNPAGTGQSVILTATVTSQFGGAATGTVVFYSGSQTLGTVSLSGTQAILAASFATPGSYSITAHYNGDGNNVASTSAALNEIVITSTTTMLASSRNPSTAGQSVTFTAMVTSNAGSPPNGESITFYNGSAILGTGMLTSGSASFTTSPLAAGVYSITASYPGDGNFAASTSATLRQVMNSTTKSPTTATLTSSLNPSIYGQKVTWTATVTTTGSVPPTGKVNFNWTLWGETYTLGTATLNSSGVATLTQSDLNADLYPMNAVYVGDANNLGSTSPVLNQTVNQATSTATLSSSPNPSIQGQSVTFTAKITSPTTTPTGPVTFTAGKTTLGTVELTAGKATFTTSTLTVGSTSVTVTYPWNSDMAESSASVTQVVQQ